MRVLLLCIGTSVALLASACGPPHIAPYVPKRRQYEVPESPQQKEQPASQGSLWRDHGSAALFYTDARALRVNDLVVVKVSEIADARRSTDTDIRRQTQTQAELAAFLQVAGTPSEGGDGRLNAQSGTRFEGQGATGRSERLTATVPAIVRQVLPNGNLFIEGHRVVRVNNEEHHFYISGVVRPIDIDQQNSVLSSMVADAEIEFTGRGALSDNQHQGFLSRFFGWIWPF